MKEEKQTKKDKLKAFMTKRNLVITALIVFFVVQFIQIQSVLGTFSFLEGRDTSLLTEIGQIKTAYLEYGEDMNEMRELLRMPKKAYGGFEELEDFEDSDGGNKKKVQLALFNYIDFLGGQKRLAEKTVRFGQYFDALKGEEFAKFFEDEALTLGEDKDSESAMSLEIVDEENVLVSFFLDKDEGQFWMETVNAKDEIEYDELEDFVVEVQKFIKKNKQTLKEAIAKIEEIKAAISGTINTEETQKLMEELGVSMTDAFVEDGLTLKYPVENVTGEDIGEVVLDLEEMEITLVDKKNSALAVQVTDISTALGPFLKKLDTKTFTQKKYEEALSELKETLADKGFQLVLEQVGYTVSEPREDDERVYFDIYDGELHVNSIVVEKATGVVNIVDSKGANAENLLFFDPQFKKKTLDLPEIVPEYGSTPVSDTNSFNILIAGKHGSLVDTMIFAHIDENRGDVRMISIPRDLFYNGRKINSFAYYYGMPELKKVLAEITGYELDKYILIDMYAFIDVVDLIGGIDITLEDAVVDPTYRTVDNGVEGTLSYEPGDYHLGGKEALRLARTRHTSSDFARAARQQMILESLQDKARNFGFGDADTIYEIAKTVLKKTETDVSLDEALSYYFRYQNYDIVSNNVMSSGNVLYVPPYITKEDCAQLIASAEAAGQERPGCENENDAYTLLPRKNNWNLIKWFFRENFEGI